MKLDADIKTETKKYTIRDISDIGKIKEQIAKDIMNDELIKFAKIVKKNVITEFKNTLSSGTSSSFGSMDNDKVYDDVLDALNSMKIERKYKGGILHLTMRIDSSSAGSEAVRNGIIKGLNSGTGVYNMENPHLIRPKNGKKYMFIPGYRFAKGLARNESLPIDRPTYRTRLKQGQKGKRNVKDS